MRQFRHLLGLTAETRILDVGGSELNWLLLGFSPHMTLLNLAVPRESNFTWVVADGMHLPFRTRAFDIVYSNSVIEHLGSFESQQLFAAECQRVGHGYYVQTPNKWFFIEPHLITPFIHWLGRRIQKKLLRNFTVWGLITRPTEQYCDDFVEEIHLLNEREMRRLFPKADIWHERFLGFSKSLIAVKNSDQNKG